MTSYPNAKVICTAPTQHQLFDVVWSELSKWYKKSSVAEMFNWKKTHFEHINAPNEWFAVARTSNKPENMQGFHAEHLLFIVDEASGVSDEVLEVIEGTQTQEGSLVIMFANPTKISGAFHDSFNSKRKFYYPFTFNAEEVTTFILPNGYPLVDPMNCEKIAMKYGRDSDIYRVRVLGEFPKAEPDTLIPLTFVEEAVSRDIELPEKYEDVEIGVDVARFGDDETVIYSRIGNVITEEAILRKHDLMRVTGEVVKVYRQYEGKRFIINVDDTGLGGGVTDRLRELVDTGILRRTTVNGVNNGSKAYNDRYYNLVSEMWFFMREKIKELKLPNDNDLIGQLSTRRYMVTSTGKDRVEAKDQMKKRGLTSPDRADACLLTLYSLIKRIGDFKSDWLYVC